MLGKIMKHEFKATWKYFLVIDFITLVIGIVSGLVCYGISGNIDDMSPTLGIFLLLCFSGYVFALFAATILTTAYNVIRYYKSLYTAEGYLTFTLPASTVEILSAKMIVAIIWQTIMSICLCISILLLIGGFITYGSIHAIYGIPEFFNSIVEEFTDLFGINSIFSVILDFFSAFMQLVMNLLIFFFAISIGQLWQKHKILGSIIAFFGCRTAIGIINFIISLMTGSFNMLFSSEYSPDKYFTTNIITGLLLSIVLSVGMYIGCIVITDRKLNLD